MVNMNQLEQLLKRYSTEKQHVYKVVKNTDSPRFFKSPFSKWIKLYGLGFNTYDTTGFLYAYQNYDYAKGMKSELELSNVLNDTDETYSILYCEATVIKHCKGFFCNVHEDEYNKFWHYIKHGVETKVHMFDLLNQYNIKYGYNEKISLCVSIEPLATVW